MTQSEKELLLKDLCARLPYGVKLYHISTNDISILEIIGKDFIDGNIHDIIGNFKPYLFPLSSMTEEQEIEYHKTCDATTTEWGYDIYYDSVDSIDWLNKNHFDYQGLIEKGLAIDATGKNIY